MIKAVVFDLDHTLFDRYATIKEVAKNLSKHFNINPLFDEEKIVETMIYHDKNFVHKGWNKIQEEIVKSGMILDELNPDDYRKAIMSEFMNIAIPFEFTIPMLENLRKSGYKTALITNGASALQRSKIKMLYLEDLFDFIYIGGEHEVQKPNVQPFLITAQKLNLNPSECVYVGDNPINDVDASRKAGYTPIHVKTTGNWICENIEQCQYSVETVEEIPKLIEKINLSF
jgi:putative hydrolase of the HAD superfamily